MCATGLAMLLMFPTGLWVWLRKRRAAEFEVTRRARSGRTRREGGREGFT
jgi:uncharacterized iron-regulated membrane protein